MLKVELAATLHFFFSAVYEDSAHGDRPVAFSLSSAWVLAHP